MIPVWFISRAIDTDRQKAFIDRASEQGITPDRIDAFDAHRPNFPFGLFADLIGPQFWGQDTIKPGAIGCFLSHRRAWQRLVDGGSNAALICEDDIALTEGLERLVSIADGIADLDVLFANDRLAAWAAAGHPDSPVVPMADVIDGLSQAGGPKAMGLKIAPGADCYLLTRRGAERLLALTADQRIVCGVDWAMVRNALADVGKDASDAFAELGLLSGVTPAQPLNAHVLTLPISRQVPAPSTLQHSIQRPIADLIRRDPQLAHTEYVATLGIGGAQLSLAGRSGPDPVMEAHRNGALWDEAGIRMLLERFPSGGTFVDIGAHIGNHVVALGKLGQAGHVMAIEANPEIHNILRANVAMNGLTDRVDIAPEGIALGAGPAEGWLLLNRRKSSETMVKREAPDAGPKVRIRITSGDDWIGDRTVDAIKIDTSGTEVDVIRGLRGTIARQKPVILIDHSTSSLERIARLAGDMGLRILATVPSSRQRRDSSLLLP